MPHNVIVWSSPEDPAQAVVDALLQWRPDFGGRETMVRVTVALWLCIQLTKPELNSPAKFSTCDAREGGVAESDYC